MRAAYGAMRRQKTGNAFSRSARRNACSQCTPVSTARSISTSLSLPAVRQSRRVSGLSACSITMASVLREAAGSAHVTEGHLHRQRADREEPERDRDERGNVSQHAAERSTVEEHGAQGAQAVRERDGGRELPDE